MNILLLIPAAAASIPILGAALGAVAYGGFGAVLGFGSGITTLAVSNRVIMHRLKRRMADQVESVNRSADSIRSGTIIAGEVLTAQPGALFEGDEELTGLLPRSCYLTLKIRPDGIDAWQPSGIRVTASYDSDLLDDDADPDRLGLGLYVYGIELEQGGWFKPIDTATVNGEALLRFHLGLGERLERIKLHYHFVELNELEATLP